MLQIILKDLLNGSLQILIGGVRIGMRDSLWQGLDHLVKKHYGIVDPLYKDVTKKNKKKWF